GTKIKATSAGPSASSKAATWSRKCFADHLICGVAMATQQGSVRVCKDCHTVTFQVVGWGRMHQSMPVRRLSEQFLAEGIASVQVEPAPLPYPERPFRGTPPPLKRAKKKVRQGTFGVVSSAPEFWPALKEMGGGGFPARHNCPRTCR